MTWGNQKFATKKKAPKEPFFETVCPKFYGQKLTEVALTDTGILFRFETGTPRELRNVVTGSEAREFVVSDHTIPLGELLSLSIVETKAIAWKAQPFINRCKLELRTSGGTSTFYATTAHDGASGDASGFRFHFVPVKCST